MGKEKVKERRDNVSTKSQNHQWTGGSWERWPEQSWSAEIDTASWRDHDWYTADSNSQTSAAAEEFQRAPAGDLRLSNLGYVKHIIWFRYRSMQNCCSYYSPCNTWVIGPQRFTTGMCVQHCRPRQSV